MSFNSEPNSRGVAGRSLKGVDALGMLSSLQQVAMGSWKSMQTDTCTIKRSRGKPPIPDIFGIIASGSDLVTLTLFDSFDQDLRVSGEC